MDNDKVIKECNIERQTGFAAENKVNVVYEDGMAEKILNYYPDELSFSEEEFIGLTKQQAKDLFHKKDIAYLQS
ncbi:MAG: hypothetical protein K0R00_49 [Herbinix sp.]|jgi:hypothetical protein|nr:hypothetical protein [Herbinix sp.]